MLLVVDNVLDSLDEDMHEGKASQKRSKVWLCFDMKTKVGTLPDPNRPDQPCGFVPKGTVFYFLYFIL